MRIVPLLPSVPVQPVLHVSDKEYAMLADLQRYPWVRPVLRYEHPEELTSSLRTRLL
jgi:hypothetical protein